MDMAVARYQCADWAWVVEYDRDAPCWSCGLPVGEASMGGTVVCAWCDSGVTRNGDPLGAREIVQYRRRWDSCEAQVRSATLEATGWGGPAETRVRLELAHPAPAGLEGQ